MDQLAATGSSSNVELIKSNKHSNEVELDPLTGATKTSDYNRRLTERVQSDVEKLKNGAIRTHRYKLHESNKSDQSSTRIDGPLSSADLPTSRSSRLSNDLPTRLPSNAGSSRLRNLVDDDDDLISTPRSSRLRGYSPRSRIRDYSPVGARLADDLGIEVRAKPTVSFNYEQEAKRRAHAALLREIDDEDEKFRTLPPSDPHRYKAREQMFANDWNEKELRYLTKEGRLDLIRPIRPAVTPEQPFKHKRKSKYGKFMEGF